MEAISKTMGNKLIERIDMAQDDSQDIEAFILSTEEYHELCRNVDLTRIDTFYGIEIYVGTHKGYMALHGTATPARTITDFNGKVHVVEGRPDADEDEHWSFHED